jgi:large conductance mechanosensitive channel
VLSFLIAALVVYYVLVLPVTRLIQLFERKGATERDCPECTMSIPVAAQRCPECTAEITPATEQPQLVTSSRAG